MEKKRKLKLAASANAQALQEKSSDSRSWSIKVDDVLEMANVLGLSFDGSEADLRGRINKILKEQYQAWKICRQ